MVEAGVNLEPYGGDVPIINISAKTGLNLDLFVDLLFEEHRRLNLQADLSNNVEVQVIEGYGMQLEGDFKASLVVKSGVLRTGGYLINGSDYFQVKQVKNHVG